MGRLKTVLEGEGFFGRGELLRRAKMSETELRQLLGQGILRAKYKNGSGWVMYTDQDVELCRSYLSERYSRLYDQPLPSAKGRPKSLKTLMKETAPRRSLETAYYSNEDVVAVWPMIREKKTCDEIFMATQIHPLVIERIMVDYARLNKAVLIAKADLDIINQLPINGILLPITEPHQIVDVFRHLAETEDRRCARCKGRPPAKLCGPCMKTKLEEKIAAEKKTTKTDELKTNAA